MFKVENYCKWKTRVKWKSQTLRQHQIPIVVKKQKNVIFVKKNR